MSKTKIYKAAILAGGLMGMGGAVQMAPVQAATPVEITQNNKQELPKPTRETKRKILPNGFGGVDIPFIDHGNSPKEYGQYLQRIGKQKWVKKQKK